MRSHAGSTTDPKFIAFLARHEFRCPGCGYQLTGLRTSQCPDCRYRVDVDATLAAYRAPGVLDFVRSRFGLALALGLNAALLIGVHIGLPALSATRWEKHPPIEYYGLLTIQLAWFSVMAVGASAWAVQLISTALHGADERRAMSLGCWATIAATLVHAAWVGLRIAMA